MKQSPTSPYVPDLEELRAWLQQMVASMKLVELVVAVVSLIARMRDVNLELTKRVAHLTRKRPRSETLDRVQRQLWLALPGMPGQVGEQSKSGASAEAKPKRRRAGGGRSEMPAHLPRVPVPNPVPDEQRHCPLCGAVMKTVGHSTCERLTVIPARIVVEQRLDETIACPNDDTIVSAAPPRATSTSSTCRSSASVLAGRVTESRSLRRRSGAP